MSARYLIATLLLISTVHAAELPSGFPADVTIAPYMTVTGVTVVRDDQMISLNAPGKTVAEVVDWFQTELLETGWSLEGELVTPTKAILPFTKGSRRCGVSVTDFVLDDSMQMDRSTKGITLQIVGGGPAPGEAAAEASDVAAPEGT